MLYADAIEQERRERAVLTEFREEELVAINAVCALVTELDLLRITAVHAIAAPDHFSCVETPLGTDRRKDKVAILIADGDIRVVTILVIEHIDAETRNVMLEHSELFEEWPSEINLSGVGLRAPSVREETLRAVHRVQFLRGVHR